MTDESRRLIEQIDGYVKANFLDNVVDGKCCEDCGASSRDGQPFVHDAPFGQPCAIPLLMQSADALRACAEAPETATWHCLSCDNHYAMDREKCPVDGTFRYATPKRAEAPATDTGPPTGTFHTCPQCQLTYSLNVTTDCPLCSAKAAWLAVSDLKAAEALAPPAPGWQLTKKQQDTIDEMRRASDISDDAVGTSEYMVRMYALALIAREFLRRLPLPAPPRAEAREARHVDDEGADARHLP